jgi:hypothetical protein
MLHETLDTQLRFYSAYHPQTDGQTKGVNQILEDMLRACALQYGRSWDKILEDNQRRSGAAIAGFESC